MATVLEHGSRVLFIGDSVTDCRRRDDRDHLGGGYVRLVQEQRPDLAVVNRGIAGDRTADLVARWRRDCVELHPDVLTILVGVNDTWRRYDRDDPTSTEVFEANYRSMLTTAPAARVVLMEPFLLPVRPDQETWLAEDLAPKAQVVARLAAQFGHWFLPLGAILREAATEHGAAALAADGVHPTPLGHQLIARAWLHLVA